ncbi:hypothetical protein D3C73_1462380 [compost metagenome]
MDIDAGEQFTLRGGQVVHGNRQLGIEFSQALANQYCPVDALNALVKRRYKTADGVTRRASKIGRLIPVRFLPCAEQVREHLRGVHDEGSSSNLTSPATSNSNSTHWIAPIVAATT